MNEDKDKPAPQPGAHEGGADTFRQLAARAQKELHEEKAEQEREVLPDPRIVMAKRILAYAAPVAIVLSWLVLLYIGAMNVVPDLEPADPLAAEEILKEIVEAQKEFLEGEYRDLNSDGIPDYGELTHLADPAGDGSIEPLIDPELAETSEAHGFLFSVHVVGSVSEAEPSQFHASAVLIEDSLYDAQSFSADASGLITLKNEDDESFISEVEIE